MPKSCEARLGEYCNKKLGSLTIESDEGSVYEWPKTQKFFLSKNKGGDRRATINRGRGHYLFANTPARAILLFVLKVFTAVR